MLSERRIIVVIIIVKKLPDFIISSNLVIAYISLQIIIFFRTFQKIIHFCLTNIQEAVESQQEPRDYDITKRQHSSIQSAMAKRKDMNNDSKEIYLTLSA
jgi:hypothetical protein